MVYLLKIVASALKARCRLSWRNDMPRNALALLGVSLGIAGTASAEELDCGAVLRAQAFDTTDIVVSQNIMLSQRDAICSREYDRIEDARASARSSGFNLVYDSLSIGADDARETNVGRLEISETQFCQASLSDFESAYNFGYQTQVASIATQNWLECIQVAGGNRLYLEYTPNDTGSYFTGHIRRQISGENITTFLAITGLNIVGPGRDEVTCQIDSVPVDPQTLLNEPLEVETSRIPVSCERSGDSDVAIGINTTSGGLDFVELPSSETREIREWNELRQLLQSTESALRSEFGLDLEAVRGEIGEEIDNRISSIEIGTGTVSSIPVERGDFWNPNPVNEIRRECPDNSVLIGMEWHFESRSDVRSPIHFEYICSNLVH